MLYDQICSTLDYFTLTYFIEENQFPENDTIHSSDSEVVSDLAVSI